MNRSPALWLLVGVAACAEAAAQDPIEVGLDALPCASGAPAPGEPWESAQWPPFEMGECRWLRFDGRETYRVAHELGRRPRHVGLYLSFDETGRNSAPSAGDATRIVEVDDATITLRNGTHQDFYLKIVLQ